MFVGATLDVPGTTQVMCTALLSGGDVGRAAGNYAFDSKGGEEFELKKGKLAGTFSALAKLNCEATRAVSTVEGVGALE